MRERFIGFKRLSGFITAVVFLLCFTLCYGSTVLAADDEVEFVNIRVEGISGNIALSAEKPYYINGESSARSSASNYNLYFDKSNQKIYLNGFKGRSLNFGDQDATVLYKTVTIDVKGTNTIGSEDNNRPLVSYGARSVIITSSTNGILNLKAGYYKNAKSGIHVGFGGGNTYDSNLTIKGNVIIDIDLDTPMDDEATYGSVGITAHNVYISDQASVDIDIDGISTRQNYCIQARKKTVSITTNKEISLKAYNPVKDYKSDHSFGIYINDTTNPEFILQNCPKLFIQSVGYYPDTMSKNVIGEEGIEGYKITNTGVDQQSYVSDLTTTIEQSKENITDVSVNAVKPVHGKKALLSNITVDKDAPYYIASEQPCYWLKASYGHEGTGDYFTDNSFEKDEYYDSVIYLRAKSGYTFDYTDYQSTINPKVNGITRSSVASGNGSTVFTAQTWKNNDVTYYVIHRTYKCEGLPLSGSTIGVNMSTGFIGSGYSVERSQVDVQYYDRDKFMVYKYWWEDASGNEVDTEGIFEGNRKYTCKAILQPINGYTFDGSGSTYNGQVAFNQEIDGVKVTRLNGNFPDYGLTNVEDYLLVSKDYLTGPEEIEKINIVMEKGSVGMPTSGYTAASSDVRIVNNAELSVTYAVASKKKMNYYEVIHELWEALFAGDEDRFNEITEEYGLQEVGDTFEEGLYYYPVISLRSMSGFKFKVDSDGNPDVNVLLNDEPDHVDAIDGLSSTSITVYLEPFLSISAPEITTSSLPDTRMGLYYNEDPDGLKIETNTIVKEWSIVSGSLPSGISLTSDGYIKGKAYGGTSGTYTFSVKVENDAGSSVKEMSMTVLPKVEITDVKINFDKIPIEGQYADKSFTFDVTPAEAKPYIKAEYELSFSAYNSSVISKVENGDEIIPGLYYISFYLIVDDDYQDAFEFKKPYSLSIPTLNYENDSFYLNSFYCMYSKIYYVNNGHTVDEIPFKYSECEIPGHEKYYKCLDCGKCFEDDQCITEAPEESFVIKPRGHYWEYTYVDKDKHSMICKNDHTHTGEGTHEWDDGFVSEYPTCTEAGVFRYTCNLCHGTKEEEISATGHEMGDWTSVDDEKHTRKCIHPGCTESEAEAHDYEVISTTPATEDSTGEIKYQCTVCGHEYVKELPKLDHTHDMTKTDRVEAKCETAGNIEYYTCSKCHKTFSDEGGVFEVSEDDIVIPATGHDYEVIYEEEATVTTDGKKVSKCNNCGDEVTEIIPKLPAPPTPTPTPTPEVTPTPTSDPGLTATPTPAQTTPSPETQPTEEPGTQPTPSAGPEESKPETPFSAGSTEDELDKAIAALPDDNDPAGTEFAGLQAKVTKVTKNSIKLSWKKISGADGYIIYANKCGKKNKYEKLTTVKKNSITIKKVAGKKLKKGTYYKFLIVSVDSGKKVLSTSKTIHVATTGGKNCNDKKVTTKAKGGKVALKVGKTFKLKAKAVPEKKKKKVARHRKVAYESTDESVATVSAKGVITAKKKGTCYVYAYAQNGVAAKIKVTVR